MLFYLVLIKRGEFNMKNLITGNKEIFQYVFGGNSTFTLRNTETGNRYTYKIKKSPYHYEEHHDIPFFVKVLTNPDKYSFMGTIFFTDTGKFVYKHSFTKSSVPQNSQCVRTFVWFLDVLKKNCIPQQVEFWHCGKCCRCGRKLTVPESIVSGIGPECMKKFSI